MTKIVYWECDRCKKKIEDFKEIAIVTFIGKQKELCKECQEDFKKWLKTRRKSKQNGTGDKNGK